MTQVPLWMQVVQNQIKKFISPREEMEFQTSGSTGTPKQIIHKKSSLEASAIKTLDYFSLQPGDSAALILPAQFIGGSMMLIRALVGGLKLHLIEPNLVPEVIPNVDFLPCTPAQFKSLQSCGALDEFKGDILLGGAPVNGIEAAKLNVYVGYGMTETASHVALRKLSSLTYRAVDGVNFHTVEGTLVIDAPHIGVRALKTNDLVELKSQQSFVFTGRADPGFP